MKIKVFNEKTLNTITLNIYSKIKEDFAGIKRRRYYLKGRKNHWGFDKMICYDGIIDGSKQWHTRSARGIRTTYTEIEETR